MHRVYYIKMQDTSHAWSQETWHCAGNQRDLDACKSNSYNYCRGNRLYRARYVILPSLFLFVKAIPMLLVACLEKQTLNRGSWCRVPMKKCLLIKKPFFKLCKRLLMQESFVRSCNFFSTMIVAPTFPVVGFFLTIAVKKYIHCDHTSIEG